MLRQLLQLAIILSAFCSLGIPTAVAQIRFNEQIRPILSDKCFFCHGPDAGKREADLRLDVYEVAVGAGAIVPGQPDASEMIRRIESKDPDLQMPPPSSKLPSPTDTEVRVLKQWITEGAKFEKHWSFEPLDFKALGSKAEKDPIDSFVIAELAKRGLTLQPAADRNTLARRAAFDVTGLPPDETEHKSFLEDRSPTAWETYLDRLLATPYYGERMATDWLDIARYADSYGFQVDREREMWPWRDWVVKAFNTNKPFDEFIVEQLAGDLLPSPSQDQILATAFNRLHQQESEGGSVEEEYRVEYVADRVQTYSTAFLGLTFECARCHDHKFDPLKQSEYYQLFAMFQNIDEAGLYSYFTESPPTPALGLADLQTESKINALADAADQAEKEWFEAKQATATMATEWLASSDRQKLSDVQDSRKALIQLEFESIEDKKTVNAAKADAPATVEGENKLVTGKSGFAIEFTGDDPVKTTQGNFGRQDPFSVSLWLQTPEVKERAVIFHRSRAWTDAASRGYELLLIDGKPQWSLIHFWPGNAISIRAKKPIESNRWTHVSVSYDGSSRADGLQIYIDGTLSECETIRDGLSKQITGGGYDSIDLGERFRDRGFRGGKIDSFQVFPCELTALEVLREFDSQVAKGFQDKSAAALTDFECEILKSHYAMAIAPAVQKSLAKLREEREKWYTSQDGVKEIMVMRELPTPKPAYILTRGEYQLRGAEVTAGTPAALSQFPDSLPRNRLGLARWTVSPDHPLTARVTVNRVWQSLFGRGLVKTSEDFGSQGSRPKYPQVLDSLSIRFIQHRWNMKELMKTIMLSKTYQQRSVSDEANMADDPENEWLARGPRFRLPAEMIRDNAISIAGLLDTTMGGPPVHPFEMNESFKPTQWSAGNGVYRRSLYTNWRRTGPPPAMVAFDAPRRAVCTAKRERTDSPLQALILLNGVQYVDAARGFATQLLLKHTDDTNAMIESAFDRCLSRLPDAIEIRIATKLLEEQVAYFDQYPDRAKEFLSIGRVPIDESIPMSKLAGTTVLCQALMNHDACVVKR